MARLSFIQINVPVILKVQGSKSFRTIIQEVWDDSFAVLAPGAQEAVLAPGSEVKVVCYRKDARYEFATRVTRYMPGEPPLYRLGYPEDYRRFQFRAHVRIKAALEFRYALWPEEDWPHRPPLLQRKGITVDLSGGGAQLVLPEPVEVESLLYLEIDFPGAYRKLPLHLAARVKRCALREIEGVKMFVASVAFEGISLKQEDQITAFVFQQLLQEKRQRG